MDKEFNPEEKNEHSCENGNCCGHVHGEEGHDCTCHDHHEEEVAIVELTLDDGSLLECEVIGDFYVEGQDRDYIALVTSEERELLIYRLIPDEETGGFGGNAKLDMIETDEEYEEVVKVFSEIFFDGEIEEMDEE
ncbi:DUF1292 domain-containing protein [Lagierella sp.]|uniref:DUF1292 domain-containing protein n=1 Tax=Lagierella sp. TaxID=2849657 RepID=UPI00262A4248|nr:DUF1292 domain-containing protein [Lagierella sp.]